MFKPLSIVGLALLVLAACGDGNTDYKFKGVVTGKLLDNGSSEPYRLAFDVSLNKGKAKAVECRLKNPLKPLWEGLRVGGTVRLEKTTTYKYTEKTFCGLLNDAVVKDVLEGQRARDRNLLTFRNYMLYQVPYHRAGFRQPVTARYFTIESD